MAALKATRRIWIPFALAALCLLAATWAELALRRGPGSREAAYLDVLARGAEELFAAGPEAGRR